MKLSIMHAALVALVALVVGGGVARAERWDSKGWVKLGEREVNGKVDHDRIEVGRYEGKFTKLTLYVENSDLELLDFEVTFGNKDKWHPEVRHMFKEGSRTRVIDLPGDERVIKHIDLTYKNLPRGGRARVFGLALVVMLGCSHDAKPVVQPDEQPPLPPASGTPIGYLIDDASELELREDQLAQLKAIDDDLSARLDVLDTELRSGDAAPATSTPVAGRHRGGRRGGMGGNSMGGRGMAGRSMGGSRAGRSGAGAGSGSGSATPKPAGHHSVDAVNRATEERAADVREALQRAFALFDPTQQQMARRVLADRGVDLDTDHAAGTPAGAEPAAPDTGSDHD